MASTIRAVSYCRVSTFDQVVTRSITIKSSLDEQKQLAGRAIEEHNWAYTGDYREEGISGEKFEERPLLQKLLADARTSKFDIVIVANGDRLARLEYIYHTIIFILEQECRIPVLDLSKPLPIDPANFDPKADDSRLFMHSMQAMLSAVDQRQRTRRLMAGKKQQVEAGRFIFSHPPYGYMIEEQITNGKVERIPVPDPKEYWVLELLPKLILEENLSLQEVTIRIHELGAPTRKSKHWRRSTIARMIGNTFYAGKITYRRQVRLSGHILMNQDSKSIVQSNHKYVHPWDWETYLAIQDKRKERLKVPLRQRGNPRNPVIGLLRCGYCGSMMKYINPHTQHKSGYFLCGRYLENHQSCISNRSNVPLTLGLIWRELDLLAVQESTNVEVFYSRLKTGNLSIQLSALEQRMAEIRRKLNEDLPRRKVNLENALLEGLSYPKYQELNLKLIAEQEELEGTLMNLETELNNLTEQNLITGQVRSFLEEWRTARSELDKPLSEWPPELTRFMRYYLKQLFRQIQVISNYHQPTRVWAINLQIEWNW